MKTMGHRDIAILIWRTSSGVRHLTVLAAVAISAVYISLMTIGMLDWRNVIRSDNEAAMAAAYSGLAITGTLLAVGVLCTAFLWMSPAARFLRGLRVMLPVWYFGVLAAPIVIGLLLVQNRDHRFVFGVAALSCAAASVLLIFGAGAAYWRARTRLKRRVIGSWGQVCPQCSYDLGGRQDAGKCPECGRSYSSSSIPLSWRYWLDGP